MSHLVRALGHRNFRLYFGGQLVSLAGTWMQQVALGWLVYRLTGSVVMLGLVTFIGQVPTLFLAPLAGVLADRTSRRVILIWTQSLAALHAAVLAALTLSHVIDPHMLVVMAFLLGLINGVDQPVRQAFIPELVEHREDIPNAIALTSFTIHSSRFIGPTIGGILVATVGEGVCFAVNAVSFLGVLVALSAVRTRPLPPMRHNVLRALGEGFSYAFSHQTIRILLVIVATAAFFGSSYTSLLPYFAHDVFAGDAKSFGYLSAAAGIGACLGTIFLASQKSPEILSRTITIAQPLTGAALIVFALTHSFPVAVAALAVTGFTSINTVAASNALIQAIVEDHMRGRVMAIFAMCFFGVTPVGALVAGYAAHDYGGQHTIFFCGCVVMVVAAACGIERRWRAAAPLPSSAK